jgi:hypothetical protein
MLIRDAFKTLLSRGLTVPLASLFLAYPALCADKPKVPGVAPPKSPAKAAQPAKTSAKKPNTAGPSTTATKRSTTDVHRTPSGNRRVVAEHPDHSRVVAERGGRGYVQAPYRYHDREYARRSYYSRGHYYHAYYGRYQYRGVYVNPYYPTYYYGPAYYSWVSYPWSVPAPYAWGWNANPWYGYYGAFFTPYTLYPSASLWLTDYIIANSLAAAYQAQAAAFSNPAPLTPDVKQLIAEEVRQQISLEYSEAQAVKQDRDPDPAASSIQQLLNDGKSHVLVAGQDLDVVDSGGTECALSEGDALQLAGRTPPEATAANLTILASKGGRECPKGDTVAVALQDLQEMQNHMRETIDAGLQELREKQGQSGLPAASAAAKAPPTESPMAAIAPPPPPEGDVVAQIAEQTRDSQKD